MNARVVATVVVAAMLLTALPAAAGGEGPGTRRVAGDAATPTDAAVALSQVEFVDAVPWAVVARDDEFADGLTAAVVADGRGPVLFTGSQALTDATRAELERVLPDGAPVYVMGGEAAVAATVADELAERWEVVRVAGTDRVGTALAAARLVDDRDRSGQPPTELLVAAGFNWPDAVSGGAAASQRGAGLLLLNENAEPTAGSNADVLSYVDTASPAQAWILGGTAALPQVHAEAVAARSQDSERLAGRERSGTATAVAAALWSPSAGFTLAVGFPPPGVADDATDVWGYALAASVRAVRRDQALHLVHGRSDALGTWDGVPVATAARLDQACDRPAAVVGAAAVVADATLLEIHRWRCAGMPAVTVDVVTSGLDTPWGVAELPDGRILVTERDSGQVRLVEDGQLHPAPLWTAPDLYNATEAGLMDIVAEPDFASTGRFLVCLTQNPGPRVRVLRLAMTGASSAGVVEVVADVGRAAPTHDGCALDITAEGHLLVTVGDAQNAGDARDPSRPNGKVHRMTLTGDPVAGNAAGTVWTVGHRNPQGIDEHPVTRVVLAVEHGPGDNDEVNVLRDGGDYGWPTCSGPCDVAGVTNPIWASGSTTIATAAGAVAGEASWQRLRGALVVATLKGRTLYALPLTPDGTAATAGLVRLVDGFGRLRAVEPAAGGGLWVTTSNCDGRGSCPATGDALLLVRPS